MMLSTFRNPASIEDVISHFSLSGASPTAVVYNAAQNKRTAQRNAAQKISVMTSALAQSIQERLTTMALAVTHDPVAEVRDAVSQASGTPKKKKKKKGKRKPQPTLSAPENAEHDSTEHDSTGVDDEPLELREIPVDPSPARDDFLTFLFSNPCSDSFKAFLEKYHQEFSGNALKLFPAVIEWMHYFLQQGLRSGLYTINAPGEALEKIEVRAYTIYAFLQSTVLFESTPLDFYGVKNTQSAAFRQIGALICQGLASFSTALSHHYQATMPQLVPLLQIAETQWLVIGLTFVFTAVNTVQAPGIPGYRFYIETTELSNPYYTEHLSTRMLHGALFDKTQGLFVKDCTPQLLTGFCYAIELDLRQVGNVILTAQQKSTVRDRAFHQILLLLEKFPEFLAQEPASVMIQQIKAACPGLALYLTEDCELKSLGLHFLGLADSVRNSDEPRALSLYQIGYDCLMRIKQPHDRLLQAWGRKAFELAQEAYKKQADVSMASVFCHKSLVFLKKIQGSNEVALALRLEVMVQYRSYLDQQKSPTGAETLSPAIPGSSITACGLFASPQTAEPEKASLVQQQPIS